MLAIKMLGLLSLFKYAAALPQIVPVTQAQCGNPDITYKTDGSEDGTGDWKLWEGSMVHGGDELGALESESHTVSTSWSIGGEADLGKAMSAGLEFGVEVSTTHEKGIQRVVKCDGDFDCTCGLIYKDHLQKAWGKRVKTYPGSCGSKPTEESFEVTAPIRTDGGSAWTDWAACRSSQGESSCHANDDLPACPEGK